MAGLGIITSTAETRGRVRRRRGMSCCDTTPCSTSDSCARTCGCWFDGKMSMMRLMVCTARVGVQSRQHQVAGFGHRQRRRHGLQIPHFADQHDVRVLSQDVPQGLIEGVGVGEHLALVDQTVAVVVHEFDRVFDGHDVLVPFAVDLVDHRRQRRGLAAPGRSGHEHEPARQLGEFGRPRAAARVRQGRAPRRESAERPRRRRPSE